MRSTLLLALAVVCAGLPVSSADPDPPATKLAPPDLKRDVMPILEAKCNRCHGAKQKGGKLDLRTREAMLKGGNTGAAIEPGNADKSLLVELIHFNEMPPKKAKPRVTADELKVLKDWIKAGAPEK
jgi:cytochrome c5